MSDKPSVVECLSTAMEAIRAVGKTGKNAQQNYNFRGIDAVVNAAGPAFRRHGIVPTPRVSSTERETVEVGKNRTLMALVTVKVTYRFTGPAGDYLEAVDVPGEAMDSGDKAVSKAMSVAYRIALLQTLCIPTDEPDADEHSYERATATDDRQSAPAAPAVEYASKEQVDAIKALTKELSDDQRKALVKGWVICDVELVKGGAIVATRAQADVVADNLREVLGVAPPAAEPQPEFDGSPF